MRENPDQRGRGMERENKRQRVKTRIDNKKLKLDVNTV